jgi:hypothetical protein
MKICVVGLGYVGLPAACVLAQAGHEVDGVEIRNEVVDGLNQCQLHIEEPGLHDLLQEALANKRFKAQITPEQADAFIHQRQPRAVCRITIKQGSPALFEDQHWHGEKTLMCMPITPYSRGNIPSERAPFHQELLESPLRIPPASAHQMRNPRLQH